jgi:hypothetical protein
MSLLIIVQNGNLVVEMIAISYGFVKAAHYFWKGLMNTFVSNGYVQRPKDKCLYIKRDDTDVAYCRVTVDDYFFVMTRNPQWKRQ